MKILSGFQAPDSGSHPPRRRGGRHPLARRRHRLGHRHAPPGPPRLPAPQARRRPHPRQPGPPAPRPHARPRGNSASSPSRFDFDLDPEAYVDALTVGERQQLEILRLLWLGAKALILDEPTTGISLPQKEKLFATIRRLASEGMTVLFVSHKLEDVEALCDRAVVLRQGALVGAGRAALRHEAPRRADVRQGSAPVVRAGGAPSAGPRSSARAGSASTRSGSRSRTSTSRVCAGRDHRPRGHGGLGPGDLPRLLRRPRAGRVAGSVCIEERDMTSRSHHDFKREGVAYLPAARLEEGLVPGLSLEDHFILAEGRKAQARAASSSTARAAGSVAAVAHRGLQHQGTGPTAPSSPSRAATSSAPSSPSCARSSPSSSSSTRPGASTSSRPSTSGPSSRSAAPRARRSCSSPRTWTRYSSTATASSYSSRARSPLRSTADEPRGRGARAPHRRQGLGALRGPGESRDRTEEPSMPKARAAQKPLFQAGGRRPRPRPHHPRPRRDEGAVPSRPTRA